MPDASVDSVVTDPPYGLGKEPKARDVLRAWLDGEEFKPGGAGFMGKSWDAFVPSPLIWAECLRVLKPGGHLVAFAGSRTYDWIVMGVRLAGLEVRDQLFWMYGSGFPKSLDVSKAIDRAAGAERERVINPRWEKKYPNGPGGNKSGGDRAATIGQLKSISGNPLEMTLPATDDARQWEGWGTALKPSHEPIVLARKPLSGTVADNVLEHGTGAINVDGCRVETADGLNGGAYRTGDYSENTGAGITFFKGIENGCGREFVQPSGRWPANILHDGSPEVLAVFPDQSDRFYYCAKASRAERELGLADFTPETVGDGRKKSIDNAYQRGKTERRNVHPTVKPVAVMRWLVRLVTPPGGTVLDPYSGSGTTGVAAALEGFGFIGCELSPEYVEIARARIAHAREFPAMWEPDYQPPDEVPEEQLDLFATKDPNPAK